MKTLVIIPTITGREEQFERCMKSVQRAARNRDVQIVSEKDTTREEILRHVSLKGFDYVTFIDDDDYVTSHYFDAFTEDADWNKKKRSVIIVNRVGIYPTKAITYTDASVMLGNNSLFDYDKVSTSKGTTPIWYITGVFFSAKLMEEFRAKVLSKYDIKGCWEDLMYWAFIEKECTNLNIHTYDGASYVQVCVSNSLTRKNPEKDSQMDYNMNLVRDYLESLGTSKESIDFCFKRINRCRKRKYGEYGSVHCNSGKIKTSDEIYNAETFWLLESELKQLPYFHYNISIRTFLLDKEDLPKKVLKWLGKTTDTFVVTRIRSENFSDMREYDSFRFKVFGAPFNKYMSDEKCLLFHEETCHNNGDTVKCVMCNSETREYVYMFWEKSNLEKFLKWRKCDLEVIYSKQFVEWIYSKLRAIHENEGFYSKEVGALDI